MAAPAKVSFMTYDGIKIWGDLYSAGTSRPCIIMTHGFAGKKEHFLPAFAQRFQMVGYTVLLYDNRCYGESEGLPRSEVDPLLQTRDYYDGFDYASTLPDVDPKRIVYWGTSMSGGNAICAAAVNTRVAAVIVQSPFVSGEAAIHCLGPAADLIIPDRGMVRRGGHSSMIPVFPDSLEEILNGTTRSVLRDPGALKFTEELARNGLNWDLTVTMQRCRVP